MSMRMSMQMKGYDKMKQAKVWLSYLLFLLVSTLLLTNMSLSAANRQGELTVTFINVGQGDCMLLQSEGESMLVDGGRAEYGSNVVEYLKSIDVDSVTYALITHDDPDHIGGYNSILKSIKVGHIFHTALRYNENTNSKKANNLILSKKIPTSVPVAGTTMKLGCATIEFLAPNGKDYKAYNDNSIVIRVVNGNNSFLLTGDAEAISEKEMIARGYTLKSDVLKVGHHSALTSTSQEFVNAVNPAMSVISCNAAGAAGFPRLATLAKLTKGNIYRTDVSGTIVMTSDGENITTDADPYIYANSEFDSKTGAIKRTLEEESVLLKNVRVLSEYEEITLHKILDDDDYELTISEPLELTFKADAEVTKLDSIEYALVPSGEDADMEELDWKQAVYGKVAIKKDFIGNVYVKFTNALGNIVIRKTTGFVLDCKKPTKCKVVSNFKNLSMESVDAPNTYRRYTLDDKCPILDFSCDYGISGKGDMEYMLVERGEAFQMDGIWTSGETVIIKKNFIGRVYVRFTDGAGNESIYKTQGFTWIKGGPTNVVVETNVGGIQIMNTCKAGKKMTTRKTVKLKFSADFGHGGKKAIRYQLVKRGEKYNAKAKWVTGSSVTLRKGFSGSIYVKFVDHSNRSTIRKTNYIQIK